MTTDVCSFAITADGQHFAVGDGPELLVYRHDGEPVYKHFCDGVLLGIAYVGDHLATVDSENRVVFYRATDGRKMEEVQLDGVALGAFASPDGLFGVITGAGPVIVAPDGSVGGFPLLDLVAASFGPDRTSLGLGTSTGHFVAMDGLSGAAWGSLDLGEPVLDVAWNTQGFWSVIVSGALLRIDGGATSILGRHDLTGVPRKLALNADGALGAVLYEGGRVGIIEQHTHANAGEIVFRREAHGLGFGRSAQLGVGLDDGDASVIDLITRSTIRTEPHPGRGRNNWNVDLGFDAGAVRAAITLLKSGGVAPELQLPVHEMEGGQRGWLGVGCMMANMFFFLSMGCLGVVFLLTYLQYP
jgi:hypothetical protein